MSSWRSNWFHLAGWHLYFVCLFVLPVVGSFLRKLSDWALLGFFDEMALLLCTPLALAGLRHLARSRRGLLLVVTFVVYITVGVVSAVWHGISTHQVLYQAALEMKYMLMILIAFGIPVRTMEGFYTGFVSLAKVILGLSFVLVLFQLAAPDIYNSVFQYGGHYGVFILPNGTALPRAAGIFWFPGTLAVFSGLMAAYFYFQLSRCATVNNLFWMMVSAVTLIATLSRLEIISTVFGIVMVSIMLARERGRNVVLTAVIGLFLLVTIAPFLDILTGYATFVAKQHSLFSPDSAIAPRTVFYVYGAQIVAENFPFGSGLGTFGGQAAALFGSPVYEKYGFESFWWFRAGVALTDTFWPHIFGESGVLGGAAFLLSLFYLLKFLPKRRVVVANLNRDPRLWLAARTAYVGMTIILINSLTSPNLYELIGFGPVLLFLAYASNRQRLHVYA